MGSPVRLHVVCGGGTGSLLLRKVHAAGYRLSAGPLSSLDGDRRTALDLGAEVADFEGARGPPAPCLARARELLATADGIVLSPFAVGTSNLSSLSLAVEAPGRVPVFLVEGAEFARRDYTGGEAGRVYTELQRRAVVRARSLPDLMPRLAERLPPR